MLSVNTTPVQKPTPTTAPVRKPAPLPQISLGPHPKPPHTEGMTNQQAAYDFDHLATELAAHTAWDAPHPTDPLPLPPGERAGVRGSSRFFSSHSSSFATAQQPDPSANPPQPSPALAKASDKDSPAEASDKEKLAEASDEVSPAEASDNDNPAEPSDSTTSPTHCPLPIPHSPASLLDLLADPGLTTPQLCHHLNLSPTQLADLIASPETQQLLRAARAIDTARAELFNRQAIHDATDALRHTACNERAAPDTRRKAASAILRSLKQSNQTARTSRPAHAADEQRESAGFWAVVTILIRRIRSAHERRDPSGSATTSV